MKNSLPKIIVASLLALLLLGGSSLKEAVHACASHADTVHQHRNDGQLQLDAQHHHCDFLSYCFPPFITAGATASVFCLKPVEYVVHVPFWKAPFVQVVAVSYEGRGPPVESPSPALPQGEEVPIPYTLPQSRQTINKS